MKQGPTPPTDRGNSNVHFHTSREDYPEEMKIEAQKILHDVHQNEHREKMRLLTLGHNALLWVCTTILCAGGSPWFLLLLVLTDFGYRKK